MGLKKITKNFSSLIIAHVIYKAVTFIMMICTARFLQAEGFGQFSYAVSFVWAFLFLSDMGMSDLFIRDVSADNKLLHRYVNNIITIKIFLGSFTYCLLGALAYFLSGSPVKFMAILILGAAIEFDSFMYFFRCIFRIKEEMHYEALLLITESVLKLVFLLAAIRYGGALSKVAAVSLAFIAASLINLLISLGVFVSMLKSIRFMCEWEFCVNLLKNGFPIAIVYILSLINFRVDIILLSLRKGDLSAGLFNAGYKLVEQFILIPITLSTVFLPIFSKSADSPKKIDALAKKIMLILFISSIFIVAGIHFFGAFIVEKIYGENFKESGQYIFIVSLALIPLFVKPILEKLLYVIRRQSVLCLIYLAGVIANAALNFMLIPKYGIKGLSITTFSCEVAVVSMCIFIYARPHFPLGKEANMATDDSAIEKGLY